MVAVAFVSDAELALRVRAGDGLAGTALLDRHRPAVAGLGPSPAFRSLDASGRHALAHLRRGSDGDLPFRMVWLSLHATGALPPAGGSVVWTAFTGLPAAWRTAIWHREVEG